MTTDEAKIMLIELHKNKQYKFKHQEAKFLEDLAFFLQFDNMTISEEQSKILQSIHRKASA